MWLPLLTRQPLLKDKVSIMFQMDTDKYKELTAPCFRDEAPPCVSACPLGMDIRKFISRMKSGKYKAAYRVLRSKTVFPGIVSELCPGTCMQACTRAVKGGEPVRMRELEAFCFEKGVQKPERYRLAKKEQKIAVIGGGLSGLSCAYRLSSRGYHINVYEKLENVGGIALSLMDPEKALADIKREFAELDVCCFETGHEVSREALPGLTKDFNAVYIATGENGTDFGLSLYENMKTNLPGVFMGGRLTGEKNLIEAMADGLNAAEFIELYFKLGYDAVPDFEPLGIKEPDARFYALDYEEADQGNDIGLLPDLPETDQDARFDPAAESAKCYECNCDKCYRVCPLMQHFQKYPKKMAVDTITTLRPYMVRRPSVRMIMGCTFCGKCREVCPEDIDMGRLYKWARQDYFKDGTMPESFHEFWLDDMRFSLSEEAGTVFTPDPDRPSGYVFFPGCQLAGMFPDIVEKAYAFISETADNPSVCLGCCGIPAEWAGAEDERAAAADRIRGIWEKLGHPVFIPACTACNRNLKEYLPEIETETLYSYMAAHADHLPEPVWQKMSVKEADGYSIFDPCGAAGDEATRKAVRMLTAKAGINAADPGSVPGCCGFGGHIYPANPVLQNKIADMTAADCKKIIAYCANCKDVLCRNGHECVHLLELYFGSTENRKLPTLGERRDNRRMLKQRLLSEDIIPHETSPGLAFADGVTEKMLKYLITEEDVAEVLKEKPAFSDPESGLLYARKRLGRITLWAVFREDEGGRLVTDLYKYRMEVQE